LKSSYLNRWTRQPSHNTNFQYYQLIEEYKKKLDQARQCDTALKQSLSDNFKYFDLVSLPRESLKNKMPVKASGSNLVESEEAKELALELTELEKLKVKLVESINYLFQILNEDNIIPQMIKVLQKKTTEQAVR
jgi:ALIX V-shaped domain binding to HIV